MKVNTQVTIKVPADAKHSLQVAYSALLSLGKVSSTFSPYIDTTLLFASANIKPNFLGAKCNCLIIVKWLNENECELFFTCDYSAGYAMNQGDIIQLISAFLKEFSQRLSLEI